MSEMLEKRVVDLERNHDKIWALFERFEKTLDEFNRSIKEALAVKGTLEGHGGQLNSLWIKQDASILVQKTLSDRISALEFSATADLLDKPRRVERIEDLEKAQAKMDFEHTACQNQKLESRTWKNNFTGSIAEKSVVAITMLLALLAAYLVQKGMILK